MQLKVKFNIDPSLPEEKAEFWLKKMTARFERITKELNSEQDFLWCYRDADAYEINFSQIYAIQIENEKTMICTQNQKKD